MPAFVLGMSFFLTAFTFTNADFAVPLLFEAIVLAIHLSLIVHLLPKVVVPRFEWVLWSIGCVLLGALAIRSALSLQSFYFPGTRNCSLMPSVLPKLECLYMQSFAQHYGLRQLFFHIVAMTCAFSTSLVFRDARQRSSGEVFTLLCVLAFPVVGASLVILENFGFLSHSVVGSAFVASQFPAGIGRVISSNPGWLWTFFAPALVLVIVAQRRREWPFWARSVAAVFGIVFLYAALVSRQRGAYLMVGTALLSWLTLPLLTRPRSLRAWLLVLGGALSLGVLVVLVSQMQLLPKMLDVLGVAASKEPFSASHERLIIWSEALRQMDLDTARLLMGSGHASWYQAYSQFATGEALSNAYATAHNFFVQLVFELGLIHAGVVLSWFALVFYVLFKIPSSRGGAFVLLMVGFPALLVQEVDHVSTVYLQYALAFGVVVSAAGSAFDATVLKRAKISTSVFSPYRFRGIVFALFAVLAVYGLSRQLSWGGMAFEPYVLDGYQFTRKFRPKGVIVFHSNRSEAPYTILEFTKRAGAIQSRCADFAREPSQNRVVVSTGSRLMGRPCDYTVANAFDELQMSFSFEILQPFFQTKVPILSSEGNWTLKRDPHLRMATWVCIGQCSAAFPSCGSVAQVAEVAVLGTGDSSQNLVWQRVPGSEGSENPNPKLEFLDAEVADYRCADKDRPTQ